MGDSFGSCYKLSTLTSVTNWCQLLQAVDSCNKQLTTVTSCWKLLQAVASFGSCYKLSPDSKAITSSCKFWQLLQAVASFYSYHSCCLLWQLLQAAAGFNSCYKLSQALTAVTTVNSFDSNYKLSTSSLQLKQISHAVTSSDSWAKLSKCPQLSLLKEALTGFDYLKKRSTSWQPLQTVGNFDSLSDLREGVKKLVNW